MAFTPIRLGSGDQLRSEGVLEEALILSTCNRSEIYGVASGIRRFGDGRWAVGRFLRLIPRISPSELQGALYLRNGHDAVRHLYRVASGLDSMLLGEAEVLGQVRQRIARVGPRLHGPRSQPPVSARARSWKRVRTEHSSPFVRSPWLLRASGLRSRFLAAPRQARLDLGSGATSERVVGHLCDRGIQHLRLINRTAKHAQDLASRFGGEVLPWEVSARHWNGRT